MAREDIVIDSQLLVLFVVGRASPDYIRQHKNLNGPTGYTTEDFDLLVGIIKRARRVIVTPHVLAETSNLVRQGNKHARDHMMGAFKALLDGADEQHVTGKKAASHEQFVRLGLTDAALLDAGDEASTLLTADFNLYEAAARAGRKVENFNHHRAANR